MNLTEKVRETMNRPPARGVQVAFLATLLALSIPLFLFAMRLASHDQTPKKHFETETTDLAK